MASREIIVEQTGGAPDKEECEVKWEILGGEQLCVHRKKTGGEWRTVGSIYPESVTFVNEFTDAGEWLLLTYQNGNDEYRLVAGETTEVSRDRYYHVKLVRDTPSGGYVEDDVLSKTAPTIN